MFTNMSAATAVSVVIPLYNKAAHVRRALDSVLDQSFADFEVIVVDDGSTDGGGRLVREYNDSRLRLIVQENAGEGAARNRGIAESKTDLIAFLDSDDAWESCFLERTLAAFEANDHVDIVFANISRSPSLASDLPTNIPEGYIDDYLEFFVKHNGRGVHPSAVLVRKAVLDQVGAFPVGVRHGADIDCWTRLALGGAQFYFVPEVLATYYTDATNRAMGADPREFCYCHEPILASCSTWRDAGRIPEQLEGSVERFVQFLLLRHARMLVDAGWRAESRRVLRTQCNPSLCGWRRYLWAYLRASTPPQLLTFSRKVKKLLNSSGNTPQSSASG